MPILLFPPMSLGLTENGKQKTPDWLAGLLGVELPEESKTTKGRTLRDVIRPDASEEQLRNMN